MSTAPDAEQIIEAEVTALDFVMRHGRPPMLGDERAPWTYRGWLLYYVLMGRPDNECVQRWDYFLRTCEAGHLLDEPIPRVEFAGEGNGFHAGLRHAEKCLELLERDGAGWSSLTTFVDWLAFGLGVEREAPDLKERTAEELYRFWNLEHWLAAPADYFGYLISERRGGRSRNWNPTGFYPTPHAVCELMARMTIGSDPRDTRALTMCEPCIGTGRLALHASNYTLRIFGMDIDPLVIKCCKINGALYAPWLAFALPETVFDEEQQCQARLARLAAEIHARLDALAVETRVRAAAPEAPVYSVNDGGQGGQGLLFADLKPDQSAKGRRRHRRKSF